MPHTSWMPHIILIYTFNITSCNATAYYYFCENQHLMTLIINRCSIGDISYGSSLEPWWMNGQTDWSNQDCSNILKKIELQVTDIKRIRDWTVCFQQLILSWHCHRQNVRSVHEISVRIRSLRILLVWGAKFSFLRVVCWFCRMFHNQTVALHSLKINHNEKNWESRCPFGKMDSISRALVVCSSYRRPSSDQS